MGIAALTSWPSLTRSIGQRALWLPSSSNLYNCLLRPRGIIDWPAAAWLNQVTRDTTNQSRQADKPGLGGSPMYLSRWMYRKMARYLVQLMYTNASLFVRRFFLCPVLRRVLTRNSYTYRCHPNYKGRVGDRQLRLFPDQRIWPSDRTQDRSQTERTTLSPR